MSKQMYFGALVYKDRIPLTVYLIWLFKALHPFAIKNVNRDG